MKAAALTAFLALAACAQTQAPPSREQQMAELPTASCGVGKVADLMGKTWAESMRADALKRSGARTLRVIAPGMAVTMDYRTDRLNIETDEAGRIIRIRCG